MQKEIQQKLLKNPKMLEYLRLNSMWYKHLNRSSSNYKKFESAIKEQYSFVVLEFW